MDIFGIAELKIKDFERTIVAVIDIEISINLFIVCVLYDQLYKASLFAKLALNKQKMTLLKV